MDRQKVYADNYNNMKIWAYSRLNIPKELAEDIVHTFYIKWMKAKIEDRNIELHPLLWQAFKNSAYSSLRREKRESSKIEEHKVGLFQVGPDVHVIPKLTFEKYCASLSEYNKRVLSAILNTRSNAEAASLMNVKISSLKNRKSLELKPLFNKIFLGEDDGTK